MADTLSINLPKLQTRFAALGILVMSVLDAFFTLRVLDLGATEANPVMAYLIERGDWAFLMGKLMLTAGGVYLLIRASEHPSRGPSPLTLLRCCFFGYACLMVWHLYLYGKLS